MLIIVICIISILLISAFWWDTENRVKAVAGWLLCMALIFVATFVPFQYGWTEAEQHGVVTRYPILKKDCELYYERNGKLINMLDKNNIKWGDNLEVIGKKAPPSLWYWNIEYVTVYIPCYYKEDIERGSYAK